ncbi:MAG: amino acid ABC transporter permease [Hahellaceae bacterium]|nr:amino acid ABC transporter permease [Hahellaceae bacterium]MCP5212125.1 amino acid ABC transporter permease [Hahellaceae bacterium]
MGKVHVPKPSLPPPSNSIGAIAWAKKHLFSTPLNSVLTIIGMYLVVTMGYWTINWAFINADWVGDSREACTSSGACWVFVSARFNQFIYGFYPESEIWRVNLMFAIFTVLLLALVIEKTPKKPWIAAFTLVVFPIIAFFLLYGDAFGLERVETHKWGGLMLTLVLAVVGIVASLPIGVLLALGRRSNMPIIKNLCVVYIEFWRGVPLITVLFMASVMLPLFMHAGAETDKLIRAMIGIVLFQAAYMAEVVRGGLQAIPKGQFEAADALGLNYPKTMGLIILPQALKLMTPGIVNTFIALFKDTSLVLIIGLFDLLAIVQSALADPKWLGYSVEGYVFVAFMFWIFCFGMSKYSQHLEKKLNTGHR